LYSSGNVAGAIPKNLPISVAYFWVLWQTTVLSPQFLVWGNTIMC